MLTFEQQALQLSMALKGAKSGLWDWDIKEEKIYFDANYFLIAGYEPDEFPHHYDEWKKRVHPEDVAPAEKAIQQYLSGEIKSYIVEFRFKTKNDEWMWILDQGEVVEYDAGGHPVRFIGLHTDITHQRLAVEALRESEERFRLSIEYAPEAITLYDIDIDCFVDCNVKATELFGCSRDEFLAGGAQQFFHAEQPDGLPVAESIANHNRQALAGGVVQFERVIRRANDQIITCEIRLVQLPAENRRLMRASFFDITERKQAEDKLRESELKFRLLADHTYDWEFWINSEGAYTYISPACEHITGYNQDELKSNPKLLFDLVRPDYTEKLHKHYEKENLKETSPCSLEFPIITKNGEEHWIEHNCFPLFDEQGNYAGRRGNNRDITNSKHIKMKLEESEERFKKLSNLSLDGVLIHKKGIAIDVNESFLKMVDYTREELIGKSIVDLLVLREYHTIIMENIEKNNDKPYEVMARKKDGTLLQLEIESRAIKGGDGDFRATTIRDNTERNRAKQEKEALEAHLKQAHKMEAIGTMAGGIAHDFNNLLSIISSNIDIIQQKQNVGRSSEENLAHIKKATGRAINIVKQILTFSRQETHSLVAVDISKVVNESLKLLRSAIPSTVEIITTVDSELPVINADSTQMQQVFINICTNAVHAMNDKGLLRVQLEDVELATEELPVGRAHQPGKYIKLSVNDTGSGMNKETLDRIFDPFFTTKGVGEGSGLGLSVAHGIIDQHCGFITVNSTPGQGTTFNMYFPRIEKVEVELNTDTDVSLPTGTERILFVDDEECIAYSCNELLEYQGYKVTSVTSSFEALEVFKKNPDEFDLVFTDQSMPEMSGKELATELLKIRQNIPIILCSGYSSKSSEEDAKLVGICEFCIKPMNLEKLATVTRKVLDESGKVT